MLGLIRIIPLMVKGARDAVICYLPGPAGYSLRHRYWKKRLKYLGARVMIETGVYFQNPEYIHIDDNCWIDRNVMILAGIDNSEREKILLKNPDYPGEPGVVHIGRNIHVGPACTISGISAGVYVSDDCCFAANCKIYAFSHHYRSGKDRGNARIHFGSMGPAERQCMIEGPVYLGTNTGVALNAVILPGVSILENSFVAINSVVRHGRYVPNSVLAGNPAEKIDDRFGN